MYAKSGRTDFIVPGNYSQRSWSFEPITINCDIFCSSTAKRALPYFVSADRRVEFKNLEGLGLDRVLTFWMKAMPISVASPYLDLIYLCAITLGCVAKNSVDYRNFAIDTYFPTPERDSSSRGACQELLEPKCVATPRDPSN
jgi:hypothetical protein